MTDPIFQAPDIPTQGVNEEKTPEKEAQMAPQSVQQKLGSSQPQNVQVQATPTPQEPTEPVSPVSPQIQPTPIPQPAQPEPTPVNQEEQTTETQSQNQINNLKAKLAGLDLQQVRGKIQTYLWYVLGGCFLLGLMFGCSMGGGSSQPVQQKVSGMERFIVRNSDIPPKVRRCGVVNISTEACRYYVLNSNTYDRKAEDFFKLVQDQVKKDEYYIRQVNPIYAQQPIHPGYFAEILVPATK